MIEKLFNGIKDFSPFNSGYNGYKDLKNYVAQALPAKGLECALAALKENEQFSRLLACDYAEHVLYLFENQYPNDKRPRVAIETARRYASGLAIIEELSKAHNAASDAKHVAFHATRYTYGTHWPSICDTLDTIKGARDAAANVNWPSIRDALDAILDDADTVAGTHLKCPYGPEVPFLCSAYDAASLAFWVTRPYEIDILYCAGEAAWAAGEAVRGPFFRKWAEDGWAPVGAIKDVWAAIKDAKAAEKKWQENRLREVMALGDA